jgi:anti-sigma regulatory factor (Ser/Thr protein kinase)
MEDYSPFIAFRSAVFHSFGADFPITSRKMVRFSQSTIDLGAMPSAYVSLKEVEGYQWRLATNDIPLTVPVRGHELSLAAAVELACLEQFLRNTHNENKLHIRFPHCGVWKLVRTLRWPTNHGFVAYDTTTLSALPKKSDSQWLDCLRAMHSSLKKHGFPHNLAGGLAGAAGEVIDNVWQHSQTDLPGLFAYQISHRKLTFCVADLGIGIMQSLTQNPKYRSLNTEMSAIQKAICPGVSRFDNGGYGFSTLLRSVAELWGKTRLRSGEAVIMFDRETEERQQEHYYLPPFLGVQISVICRLDPPLK